MTTTVVIAEPRRMRFALAMLACAVASLLAVALSPSAAAKEEVHKTLREFGPSGQYTLYISQKRQAKARIFHSRRAGAFLILDSDYGKPWLVLPRDKKVATVPAAAVLNADSRSIDLKADV